MVQLSATMEQTRETQLAQLYDVLGFRRVIARYDVLSTLHETGPKNVWLAKNDPAYGSRSSVYSVLNSHKCGTLHDVRTYLYIIVWLVVLVDCRHLHWS